MFGIRYLTLSGLLGFVLFFPHRAMPYAMIFYPFRVLKRNAIALTIYNSQLLK